MREDYDEVKALKPKCKDCWFNIEHLLTALLAVQLDERKRQAVVREDYDEAKALKTKLDWLIQASAEPAELN